MSTTYVAYETHNGETIRESTKVYNRVVVCNLSKHIVAAARAAPDMGGPHKVATYLVNRCAHTVRGNVLAAFTQTLPRMSRRRVIKASKLEKRGGVTKDMIHKPSQNTPAKSGIVGTKKTHRRLLSMSPDKSTASTSYATRLENLYALSQPSPSATRFSARLLEYREKKTEDVFGRESTVTGSIRRG